MNPIGVQSPSRRPRPSRWSSAGFTSASARRIRARGSRPCRPSSRPASRRPIRTSGWNGTGQVNPQAVQVAGITVQDPRHAAVTLLALVNGPAHATGRAGNRLGQRRRGLRRAHLAVCAALHRMAVAGQVCLVTRFFPVPNRGCEARNGPRHRHEGTAHRASPVRRCDGSRADGYHARRGPSPLA